MTKKVFRVSNFKMKLPPKKNHIGFYHNNKLYLEGGYNKLGEIEEGLFSLDLITFIVKKEILKDNNESLAYHACVFVGFQDFSDLKVKYCCLKDSNRSSLKFMLKEQVEKAKVNASKD